LKEKYPFLIDIPCAAHLMQLCLKIICEIPKIKEIISEISRIVDMIKYNKENSKKLEAFQRADGSEILKVIRSFWAAKARLASSLILIIFNYFINLSELACHA
jgi:hypothetical protein